MNYTDTKFKLTRDHIKLVQRLNLSSTSGRPAVDITCPYGNLNVLNDIAEILGKEPVDSFTNYEDWEFSEKDVEYMWKVHNETGLALQIILSTGSFSLGQYRREDKYSDKWKRITASSILEDKGIAPFSPEEARANIERETSSIGPRFMEPEEVQGYLKIFTISAVKLDLDMEPLSYNKWGGAQTAKQGDWIVNSNGEVYSVDSDEFDKTYEEVSQGKYQKTAVTYARRLTSDGSVETLEGKSEYKKGDYLCAPTPDMVNSYPVSAETFLSSYEKA